MNHKLLLIYWQNFTVTAYTSKDTGCSSISAIGMNIEKWSSYINFCAVDPDLIDYGSVVLVDFGEEIKSYIAVDTGGAIKGKHIDLYYVNDLDSAFDFGVRELPVGVIK